MRRWLILPLLALAVLPVRWHGGESRASLRPQPHLRVRTRVAARAGNKAAPLELVEQMLELESSNGLDGALAAEWLLIGRLFGCLGQQAAAQIVCRWVECRAREGGWRARAAHEALKLLARTPNTENRIQNRIQNWIQNRIQAGPEPGHELDPPARSPRPAHLPRLA